MTTIDWRTRFAGDTVTIGPEWLFDDLPAQLRDTGALGARGAEVLGLSLLGFDIDGTTAYLAVVDGQLVVRHGNGAVGVAVHDRNRRTPVALS